jgi:hypothetical protein
MEDEYESPKRGGRVQFMAIAAALITFSCVFVGETAQQFAANVAPTATLGAQAIATASPPRFNVVDFATTAAIKGGTVIIGPCDAQKSGH